MYGTTPDGKNVLFLDAFGLTRLTSPNKLKTDRTVVGRWLTVGGGYVLAHSTRSNTRVFAEAVSLKRVPYGTVIGEHTALHPDGAHTVVGRYGGSPTEIRTHDGVKVGEIALDPAAFEVKGEVSFGPARHGGDDHAQRVAVGAEGVIVVFDPYSQRLYGGRLPEALGALEDRWSLAMTVPQGEPTMHPTPLGTLVSVFHPREQRAHCVWVSVDGSAVRSRVIECLGEVSFSHGRIAYQSDARTVVQERYDLSESEAYALPAGTEGAGEVMALGEEVFFVTGDREKIVDVRGRKVIDRKLPAKEHEARQEFMAFVKRWDARLRRSNGALTLADFAPPRYGSQRHTAMYHWTHGDDGPLSHLVLGNLQWTMRFEDGGKYQAGAYVNASAIRPVERAEMLDTLRELSAMGLSLVRGLQGLEFPLQQCFGGAFAMQGKAFTPREMMAREASHTLLWAILECVRTGRAGVSSDEAAGFIDRPLGARDVIAAIGPEENGPYEDRWSIGQFALGWLILGHFGADALPIFIDWMLTRPTGMARSNAHILGKPVGRMMLLYPETRAPFEAACEALVGGADSQASAHASAVLRAVQSETGAPP